jgi:sRNA-binding protein
MHYKKSEPRKWPSVSNQARSLLAEMKSRFPVMADGKPITVMSGKLLAAAFKRKADGKVFSLAMEMYTGNTEYLKAVAAGGDRYNPITGKPEGKITEKQREYAIERLTKKLLKKQEHLLRKAGVK